MIEIRTLKTDARINDTTKISKLPTNFGGQVIRKHDPAYDVYVIAEGNHLEGLPYPVPHRGVVVVTPVKIPPGLVCPVCCSQKIVGAGRPIRHGGRVQGYVCNNCGHRFIKRKP